jgi:hypothetical protein
MCLIRTNKLVEYLPFDIFVKTCIENCNRIRMWKYNLVNMMWWMDVCDILFYENVLLWTPMSIALYYEINSVTINPKYRCENVYCHFYGMLIYFTLYGLCLANKWNVFINSQNDIVKSIKNLMTYKKQNSIDFGYEKVGLLHSSSLRNHIHSIISSSLSQGYQTIHNQVSTYTIPKSSPNHYSMAEHSVVNNHAFHIPNCIIPIHQHKLIANPHYARVLFPPYILFL